MLNFREDQSPGSTSGSAPDEQVVIVSDMLKVTTILFFLHFILYIELPHL